MEFYYLTESDPLQKFLFPCEIEALRGSNLKMRRFLSHTHTLLSSAFCPDEPIMRITLDRILHHGRLSIHRKESFKIFSILNK